MHVFSERLFVTRAHIWLSSIRYGSISAGLYHISLRTRAD